MELNKFYPKENLKEMQGKKYTAFGQDRATRYNVEIPKIEYNQIYEEMFLKMNYKSPIEAIRHEMEMRFENDVMKVVQQNDIFVEKDELLKALQYDRDQYTKGFQDGCGDKMDKLIEQVKADTVKKFAKRLKAKAELMPMYSHLKIVYTSDIDQIAKEIIKETNK